MTDPSGPMRPPAKGAARVAYAAAAALCFALAVAGTMLPVLPTTPFLLLTSFCLLRSAPGLNDRLRRSPVFGPFLRDWETRRGVRLHVKITALTSVAAVVAWSLWSDRLTTTPLILLIALAALGATVVLRLKTVRD